MTVNVVKKTGDFVLRLREKDSLSAISGRTLETLIDVTGMTKTELAHLALRRLADALLPHYEKDDGALSIAQIQTIREFSTATDIPEERFTKSLL
ncbi:hypothetical protein WCU81_01995 [Pectobacterium atrosepticum]|uniref:hypothetical protein n=1 Tax=Pectobacterium atrosepticum TaxID=29471 RepID=UPI00049A9032|nr:hypothetical protein [Pectobacterium atrosepticum]AIA71445.1 hypothetical protein EV46_12805 [Pectobacterium atrosepticum]AIK13752.1 hypothetical protein GZ59_19350 [Pectobacterium atrosepticum]POW31963.1 hypothetical protein PB72LOC_00311 [Pectobacterium atrosepticum]PWD62286.1 hypothetical protein DF214_08575 [Pectobacterium atrosepticum]